MKKWMNRARLSISELVQNIKEMREMDRRPLLDDFFEVINVCGLEHPRLEGNYCILDYDHTGLHEDAAGNEWNGKPAYDQML